MRRRAAALTNKSQREPWRRALLLALLALTFMLGCFPMSDFDVWWHLRTGQLILQNGSVPRVDFLTYTNAGRPWIDLYWLFQIGIAVLFRLGGASALVLLKATVGTAIVALAWTGRRNDNRGWPAAVVWLPAVILLTGRLCERPELFSLLFLAVDLHMLARAAERPRRLWLIPCVQVLWVNCHGFFVLGPMVLAAFATELVVDRLRPPKQAPARPPIRTFVAAALATLGACVVSPYGWRAVALPLQQFHKLGSTGIYRANIGELKTIGDFVAVGGINNPYLLGYFLVILLGIASFVLVARRTRISVFRALLFVAAVYLGWQATRNSALFGLVAAFVTTWNLDDVLSTPAVALTSRRKGGKTKLARSWNAPLIFATSLLFVATISGALYAWAGEGRTVGLGERHNWYAHEACSFLAGPDRPERIIAFNISQAAVCIAHAAPAHKLFMDPRLEVNSQETFARYLTGLRKLWRGESGWEKPLDIDYDRPAELPALLIERGVLERAARMLARDPRWRCVHADAVATVFVPTAFAQAHGLPEVGR